MDARDKSLPPLKVAMVGVGGFGAYRRDQMRNTGLYDIVAATDWNPDALAKCREADGAHGYSTWEECLDHSGVEAAFICSGAKFHFEHIRAALHRRLPVFVEKPLVATEEELAEVLRLAQAAKVPFMVGHHDAANCPITTLTARLIADGTLGEIVAVQKTTAHSGGFVIRDGDWRSDPKTNPGGMLFQCGVHAAHEMMHLFGPIEDVSCIMRYDVHDTQTADAALCHLRFSSGLIGTLNAFHVSPYRHTFNIIGTEANLYRDERHFSEGTQLVLQRRNPTGGYEPRESLAIPGTEPERGVLANFYRWVRTGRPARPDILDGARAVGVVFAAARSAEEGRWVSLLDTIPTALLSRASSKDAVNPAVRHP